MQHTSQKIRKTAGGKVSLAATKSSQKKPKALVARVIAKKIGRKIAVELSCKAAYLATPTERIEAIRHGLPAALFTQTVKDMDTRNENLSAILRLPRATIGRKLQENGLLSSDMSERLLGLRKLIGQVEVMVQQSGVPEGFSAAKWVAGWLEEPSPALGGTRPADFMDTVEGQELVSRVVARMQSGAYS